MKRKILCALLIASIASTNAFADPITAMPALTAFSYQGQLEAAGSLANGVYQFTFTLYTAANGGIPVGGTFPIHQQIIVVDGVFTTDLDFGRAFGGKQYWLEIKVGGASGAVETLSSRQAVNAVPIAQYALNSPAGAAGPMGPAGPKGLTGPNGPQGLAGDKGETGAAGATGAIGPVGAVGAAGPAGIIGATGPTGAIGATGPAGANGAAGPAGSIGATGPTGPSGAEGPAGSNGATGSQGVAGPQGIAGETGVAGPIGSAGPAGLAGLVWKGTWSMQTYTANDAVAYEGSTYISLVDDNTEITPDTDVLAAGGHWALLAKSGDAGIAGAQGAAGSSGAQGSAGPAGENGVPGAEGATGPAGAQGPMGPEGLAGTSGPQGIAGPAGSAGETGPAGPAGADGAAGLAGKGINWKGTWVGDADPQLYAKDDAVALDGSSYISLVDDNAGNSPDTDVLLDAGHWALLARGGEAGHDGQVGAAGAAGPTGPAGTAGGQGEQGSMGPMGPEGVAGTAGPQGESGFTGPMGPMGPMGQEGNPGLDGAVGPMGPQGPMGDLGPVGPAGPGSSILLTSVIATGNGSGLEGFSYYVVPSDAVASEGDGIFVTPVDCMYPKLRVVAQAGISASYSFTLQRYFAPFNSAGEGFAITGCTIDQDNRFCAGWAETTINADEGYSVRMDGTAISATTSAIAVSLSCR